MTALEVFAKQQLKAEVPAFNVGDTVKVHQRIVEGARTRTQIFEGTVIATMVDGPAYVLGKVDGEVGLYNAKLTNGQFLNNGYKAYLPVTQGANLTAAFYGFNWDGTTGVDELIEQRAESKVIFDITGRRVEAITAPGIYIVGGKKVLVK